VVALREPLVDATEDAREDPRVGASGLARLRQRWKGRGAPGASRHTFVTIEQFLAPRDGAR